MFYKKGSTLGLAFLMLLIVTLGFLIYYLFLNLPLGESKNFEYSKNNQKNLIPLPDVSVSAQFYERMRYKNRNISYVISDVCDESRKKSAIDAFSQIEELTVLNFYKKDLYSEISILCSDVAPEAEYEDHFVAGEGGPTEIINSSIYSVILNGKISLFREDTCDDSKVAVHELLHALGFNHNNNPESILYPTLDCNQFIEDQIIQDINRIYSRDSLPDLMVYNINASKTNRFLNFYIEVLNQGLDDVDNVVLSIYDGDYFVQDFNLDEIELGARKILTVENLKISRNSEKISFVIDKDDKIKELNENNNRVDLVLSS